VNGQRRVSCIQEAARAEPPASKVGLVARRRASGPPEKGITLLPLMTGWPPPLPERDSQYRSLAYVVHHTQGVVRLL
jgi:hypothetical protein